MMTNNANENKNDVSISHSASAEYLEASCERESRMNDPIVADVRALNDLFRKNFDANFGRVFYTQGVDALDAEDKQALARLIQNYDDFNLHNDPHAEHDFLAVEFKGNRYFAKIDYYDPSFKWGTEHPEDPSKCQRLLTIMLASEY